MLPSQNNDHLTRSTHRYIVSDMQKKKERIYIERYMFVYISWYNCVNRYIAQCPITLFHHHACVSVKKKKRQKKKNLFGQKEHNKKRASTFMLKLAPLMELATNVRYHTKHQKYTKHNIEAKKRSTKKRKTKLHTTKGAEVLARTRKSHLFKRTSYINNNMYRGCEGYGTPDTVM